MGLTASLTATIKSVLVLNQRIQPLHVQRLKSLQVGSVANTNVASYLQQQQILFQTYPTPKAGLRAVEQGHLNAFIYSFAS